MMESLRKLIISKYPNFFKDIDRALKIFCSEIRKELRDEGHVVIGVTGYPGKGKSNDVSVISCMIDDRYNFKDNVCYIPTSKEIEATYLNLAMYSCLHIDEASRGLHKHKWHDRLQQKLNELYDVEREGHFLCTFVIMPRFQNFTENFRNFMIKYWIDIPEKGIAIFYKRDEDKDAKDPWHLDENYKKKKDRWRNKRVFERSLGDRVRMEQITDCYWFYCEIPAIPKDIWQLYQDMKKESRISARAKEVEMSVESYKEKIDRERLDKWAKIKTLKSKGYTHDEIGAAIGFSGQTVRRSLRAMEAYERMKGAIPYTTDNNSNIKLITSSKPKSREVPEEFNNI